MHYDVVVAGGGFAGAYCARALSKMARRSIGSVEGEKRIALISERNVLVFQPMLAEVAGGALAPFDVVNPLRQFCRGINVLQGGIRHIDWANKTLTVDGGRFTRQHKITFKHLVLTLGSVTDLSVVPGMSDYGLPMKNVADAIRLRAALINRMEEANLVADPEVRARLLTFVIVGGGYTGVETAGQVNDFVREAKHYYANLRDSQTRVVLVHSGNQLLGEIGPKLGEYAQQVLVKNGVEVKLNWRVGAITAARAISNTGEIIEANSVITTIGSAANPVVMDLCKQIGVAPERGRIPTERSMRVAGQEFLWAAGDCAAVPWLDRGEMKVSPPTAQIAIRQGRQLAQNLKRAYLQQPLQPFTYRYMGQLATIGEHAAVAEVFGFHFKGFFAWWMWRTIYLAKLPGLLRKLRVMIDWTFEIIFPRDLSVLVQPADEIMRGIHLEKDEPLFEQGDVCRAFFYVRQGSLILTAEGGPAHVLPAGSVLDQADLGAEQKWQVTAVAAERSDVIAFRGKAFELLKTDLRLVKRS